MKIQAIVAHPRSNSFCHAVFERAVSSLKLAGHDLVIHDLYTEGFDPVLKADEAYTIGDTIEAALSKSKDAIVNLHRDEIAVANGLFGACIIGG